MGTYFCTKAIEKEMANVHVDFKVLKGSDTRADEIGKGKTRI